MKLKIKHILIFGLIILMTCTYLVSAEPDFSQRVVTNASNFVQPGLFTEPPHINETYNENTKNSFPNIIPHMIGLVIVFGIILLIRRNMNKR